MTVMFWMSPDRTFCKRILQNSKQGQRPQDQSKCLISIQTLTDIGSYWTHDNNYPRNANPVEVVIGRGSTPLNIVIDWSLMTMGVGETCEVYINADGSKFDQGDSPMQPSHDDMDTSEQGTGISGGSSPKRIRNDDIQLATPQVCKINVVLEAVVECGEEIFDLSSEQKYTRAKALKEIGAELFKKAHCELAFKQFSRAMKYIICMGKDDDIPTDLQSDYNLLKMQCYLNLSACQSQANNHEAVMSNCTKALTLDPANVKGLYRRGQAHTKLQDFVSAKEDLMKAAQLDSTNKAVEKLLAYVRGREHVQDQSLANAMSKMFNR